jgi:hypothetical protein
MEHETDRDEAATPVTGSASPQGAGQADPGPTWPDEEGSPEPGGQAAGDLVAARPATGEPRVDAALRLLDRLPGLPVSDHPELFEQVHAQLTDVLGELDSGSAGPADAHGG